MTSHAPSSLPSLRWLGVGVIALALSGVFSVIVAVAWHPAVRCHALFETLFHRSLIAHVNLSISVWFLCCAFMLWTPVMSARGRLAFYDTAARWLVLASVVAMSIAALLPGAVPHLNNYVPVLEHPLFFLALGLLVAAILAMCLDALYGIWRSGTRAHEVLGVHQVSGMVMLLAALLAFIGSYHGIDAREITGELYYEFLFWGGGHLLQYLWVQLMLMAWIILLQARVDGFKAARASRLILWANLLCVLCAPIPYALYDVTSGDFRQLFTLLMAWMSGAAPVAFVLLYIAQAWRGEHRLLPPMRGDALGGCLWWSLILFGIGGVFAVMIDGINVKIPAHYHGSLVGVTLALMGLAYYTLEVHGAEGVTRWRMARWQPMLLGIGQVMHIGGLFWSGGYGVQRKSPCGGEAVVMQKADLALRIQSSGGGIAILGGLLFVIVCLRAWRTLKRRVVTQG